LLRTSLGALGTAVVDVWRNVGRNEAELQALGQGAGLSQGAGANDV